MRTELENNKLVFSNLYNYSILFPGLIWSEIKQLWDVGLEEYVRDMWNVIDFITNSLYVATVALRIVSIYQVRWAVVLLLIFLLNCYCEMNFEIVGELKLKRTLRILYGFSVL